MNVLNDKVSLLIPEVQDMCIRFLAACAREGILLRVTHTRRTFEEQRMLYAQGRTAPGPRVTAAPPGYSWHNFGMAFDICKSGPDPYPEDDDWWEKVGDIGEGCGLAWGGRWKTPDRPHFEHHGGTTLAVLREAAKAEGLLA